VKSFIFFLLPEKIKTKLRVNDIGYLNDSFVEKYSDSNEVSGHLYRATNLKDSLIDHFENKLEHLLKWEDLNSMRFSLEARVPFLDHRLVEKTLASANDDTIRKGVTKYILREAMKGIVPEKIRQRKDKMGFATPQDEWFREHDWQILIEEVLKSKSFADRKIIDPLIAQKRYTEHLSGKENIAKEIWKWIHLEYWFRVFVDNPIPQEAKASAITV